MSFAKDDRKNQSIHGKSLHAERFSEAIARALHREFDHTHSAIKTVVALTGANERAVRNWFEAKNGPGGEYLVALCRHSDEVLETVLTLSGRAAHIRLANLERAKQTLAEVRALTERWVTTYNHERPHDSLGRVPPLMFLPRRSSPGQSP